MAPQIWENSLPHTNESIPTSDSESAAPDALPSETGNSPWQREGLWLVLALAFLAFLYRDVFVWLTGVWANNSDYSHGFLVPVFAAYILWSNRGALLSIQAAKPRGEGMVRSDSGLVLGCVLIGLGILTRVAGIYMRFQTLEGIS